LYSAQSLVPTWIVCSLCDSSAVSDFNILLTSVCPFSLSFSGSLLCVLDCPFEWANFLLSCVKFRLLIVGKIKIKQKWIKFIGMPNENDFSVRIRKFKKQKKIKNRSEQKPCDENLLFDILKLKQQQIL
jgi:hypothetical protein